MLGNWRVYDARRSKFIEQPDRCLEDAAGTCDITLGVREFNSPSDSGYSQCPVGPYHFSPGNVNNPCDMFHFWSFHSGGSNFVMGDGSVRFLTYEADNVMPALSTRAFGDVATLP